MELVDMLQVAEEYDEAEVDKMKKQFLREAGRML